MDRLHILLVTYEFPPEMATGGIGSYMYHLAHLLNGRGHKISVISATSDNNEKITDRGFCTNYLIPSSNTESFRLQALKHFDRYFQPTDIDLIESPEVGACGLEIILKYPQIPLIVKMHTPGVLITKVSNAYKPLITKLRFVAGALLRGRLSLGYWSRHDLNKNQNPEYVICTKASLILSPSAALKKWATTYWDLPKERIKVLPNPFIVDKELFQFPIEERNNTICFVGKLTILKGMLTFAPALKKILHANPSYNAVLIGRDEPISETYPSMKAWMVELFGSVANRIQFTGPLSSNNVKIQLGKCAIVVIPSLWENYPTVVLEAMAAGCAVAASKRGGIPEIIENFKTGILFNPVKIDSIVASVQYLIDHSQNRIEMAFAGREMIKRRNAEEFILLTEKVYSSVIHKN